MNLLNAQFLLIQVCYISHQLDWSIGRFKHQCNHIALAHFFIKRNSHLIFCKHQYVISVLNKQFIPFLVLFSVLLIY